MEKFIKRIYFFSHAQKKHNNLPGSSFEDLRSRDTGMSLSSVKSIVCTSNSGNRIMLDGILIIGEDNFKALFLNKQFQSLTIFSYTSHFENPPYIVGNNKLLKK